MVSLKVTGGKDLEKALGELGKAADRASSVDVGFMGSATEPDGTLVAEVAAHNEFGTATSPPRPFFRNTIEKRAAAWVHNLGVALVAKKFNAAAALGLVGLGMKEDVQDGIRELWEPPLAPSTVARKGFDKPLIDKGVMLNSVTLKVNTEK